MQLIPQLVKQKHITKLTTPKSGTRRVPHLARAGGRALLASGRPSPAPAPPASSSPRFSFIAGTRPPSKSAPSPVKFASDSAPLQFGAREWPVGRGGGRDCSPGSDAWIGDEPRSSRDRGRTKGRGATDRAHSSMWWGEWTYTLYYITTNTSHPAIDSSIANRSLTLGPTLGSVCWSHLTSTVQGRVGGGTVRSENRKQHIAGPAVTVTSPSDWVTWPRRTQISQGQESGAAGGPRTAWSSSWGGRR
jgi:hypothetical protein